MFAHSTSITKNVLCARLAQPKVEKSVNEKPCVPNRNIRTKIVGVTCKASGGITGYGSNNLKVSNPLRTKISTRPVACQYQKVTELQSSVKGKSWSDDLPQRAVCTATWITLMSVAIFGQPAAADPATEAALLELLTTTGHFFTGEVTPLFEAEWYSFGFVLVIYLSLLLPGSRDQKPLPALPFIIGSGGLGWFVLGPYMALREIRDEPVTRSSLSFATRNIFESKWNPALSLASAAFVLFNVITHVTPGMFEEYTTLVSTSTLAKISTTDITILSLMMFFPIVEDMKRRGWNDKTPLAAAFTAVPVFGPLTYLLVRPQLEE